MNDLEELSPLEKATTLDRWILSQASEVFSEVEAAFKVYDFSKGYSLLSHFITVELSGIYLDVTKDRLYCNAPNDPIRRSAQSTMARITQALLPLIAPVLTYTVDEVMEHGPKILKSQADEVFDLVYSPLPIFTCKLTNGQKVREKFFECVDALKKSGVIKTTMELVVQSESELMQKELEGVDREDWLTVSAIVSQPQDEKLGAFEVDGHAYVLWRAKEHKCPRCWKHKAKVEGGLCPRCEAVLNHV